MGYSLEYKPYVKAFLGAIKRYADVSESEPWSLSKGYEELLKIDGDLKYRGSSVTDVNPRLTFDSISIEDTELLKKTAKHIREKRTISELGEMSLYQMYKVICDLEKEKYSASGKAEGVYEVIYPSRVTIDVDIDFYGQGLTLNAFIGGSTTESTVLYQCECEGGGTATLSYEYDASECYFDEGAYQYSYVKLKLCLYLSYEDCVSTDVMYSARVKIPEAGAEFEVKVGII